MPRLPTQWRERHFLLPPYKHYRHPQRHPEPYRDALLKLGTAGFTKTSLNVPKILIEESNRLIRSVYRPQGLAVPLGSIPQAKHVPGVYYPSREALWVWCIEQWLLEETPDFFGHQMWPSWFTEVPPHFNRMPAPYNLIG